MIRTEGRREITDTTGMGKTLQKALRVKPELPSSENDVVKPSPKSCEHSLSPPKNALTTKFIKK